MTEPAKGIFAIVTACVVWGLSPLYYKLLAHIPSTEVLAHRTIWSLVFFGLILVLQRRLAEVPGLITGSFAKVSIAAMMISCNWFLFIWSVQVGRTVESSLGYYIFPLVAVVMGFVFFGERLTRVQWVAIALATTAVVVLTVGLGVVPVISLALATTFGIYGIIKKTITAGPVASVAAEVAVLLPVAAGWLLWVGAPYGVTDSMTLLLLVCAGPMTALPLMLFSYAARRIHLSTMGVMQYVNPTLQFFCATLVFMEPFTRWHGIAFALIWIALTLYSRQAVLQDRAARKASNRSGTVSTTV